MSEPAIRVESLSKAYRIGLKERIPDTLTSALLGWVRKPFHNFRRLKRLNTFNTNDYGATDDTIWALKEVSFDVAEGDVVGIVGGNGAGKSTLLKILSRITEPSGGRATIRGRVSSLLEVGTGFHPELTGRENIYMNGTILGMTKFEIDRKFDEMVDFSGVEKFLDTPIKHYSSGMQVRLAFSVAAHLEPEILIIDEVLAVGDADFQKKCLGKMQDVARAGRTVLFVSHNMPSVTRLCNRAILIKDGSIEDEGDPSLIVERYMMMGRKGLEGETFLSGSPDKVLSFTAIRMRNSRGKISQQATADEVITIEIEFAVRMMCYAQIAFRLNNRHDGSTVFTTALNDQEFLRDRSFSPGTYRAQCIIPAYILRPGIYFVLVAANDRNSRQLDLIYDALNFEISTIGSLINIDHRLGVTTPLLNWTIE